MRSSTCCPSGLAWVSLTRPRHQHKDALGRVALEKIVAVFRHLAQRRRRADGIQLGLIQPGEKRHLPQGIDVVKAIL